MTRVRVHFQVVTMVTQGPKVSTFFFSTGKTDTEIFDGVLMCTGHHAEPYMPEIPGLRETFKGRVLHSHSYKDDRGFEDQNVIVVGIGNSGVDVTVELSRSAKQVLLG